MGRSDIPNRSASTQQDCQHSDKDVKTISKTLVTCWSAESEVHERQEYSGTMPLPSN